MEAVGVSAKTHNHYIVECFDKDGNLRWREEFDNLVTTLGLNALLDNTFNAAAGSVSWYVGLINAANPTLAAADTMASKAWTESTAYTEGTRPAWTKNGAASAGAMSNSSSKAAFSINGTATIGGVFLTSNNTKSGTTGTLFGEGTINGSSGRAVLSGDTLNIQIDLSVS